VADYLVLEEDGTSHVELEDSTNDLLLEESGGWTDHTLPLADGVGDFELTEEGIVWFLTDAIDPVRVIGHLRFPADTVSLTDNVVPKTTWLDHTLPLADSVGITDAQTFSHTLALADSVGLADSAITKTVWDDHTVNPADSIALSDLEGRPDAGDYHLEDDPVDARPYDLESGAGNATSSNDGPVLEMEEGDWIDHALPLADAVSLTDAARRDLSSFRASQVPVEVIVGPTDADARVSQVPAEVLVRSEDQKARISQVPAEVVYQETADAHVSQVPVESVTAPVWNERQRYYDAVRLDFPDGLWRLDEASGNFVDSTGNHPFIPFGSVSYQVNGPTGSDWPAMSVTGGGGASQTSYSTQMDNISFETWFKYDAISADHQVIFANVNSSAGWALLINQNGKLQVVVNGTTYLAESQQALEPGTWYQIVVERRDGVWRYYINGAVDTPNAGTAAPSSAVTTMKLFGSSNLTASMATASYWEVALRGGDIRDHYEAVFPSLVQPGKAAWKVGVLTVPAGGGSVNVNIGKRPKAMIFYGANWTTEDAVVSTPGTAIFRGMVAPNYDFPTQLLQSACAMSPSVSGFRMANYGILNIDTSGTGALLYRATVSFTDTGFTANFDTGASGGYKVIWIALVGVRDVLGIIDSYDKSVEFGFKVEASLLHGAWTAGAVEFWPTTDPNRTQCFFGGGGYPTDNDLNWDGHGAGMTCFAFASIPYPQHLNELWNSDSDLVITSGGHSLGPAIISSLIHVQPQGVNLLDYGHHGDSQDAGMSMGWNDDVSDAGFSTPPANVDDEATIAVDGTVFGLLPFAPGLLLSYSISDEPDEQSIGVRGAGGFGVVAPDFQWCALIDNHAADGSYSRSSYMSFSNGFADTISSAGVHAGQIELLDDGFKMTTKVASIASANHWLWHAFGYPITAGWFPQIYRRVREH
jgi:hypothetical protein